MDQTGKEIKDVIEAPSQDEVQATIRQMGLFVTKIAVKKSRATPTQKQAQEEGQDLRLGGVKTKTLTTFTRQLSILQDAGLPILRSLRILQEQSPPGAMKNARSTSARRSATSHGWRSRTGSRPSAEAPGSPRG